MRATNFESAMMRRLVGACLLLSAFNPLIAMAASREATDVFAQFTQHIQRQADADKREFAHASQCMNLFYHRERQKPAPPAVQGISWPPPVATSEATIPSTRDCDARYPGGLDAVRKDFQRTQTSLSVTLTFYEFALVGDGDDNGVYSARELHDILTALDLPTDVPPSANEPVRALTGRFDAMHHSRSLESLMNGMSKLYEQGYRFSAADKANLDRVME